MSNQPAHQDTLSFSLLTSVDWRAVALQNNPVIWNLLIKHLMEPRLIDDDDRTYSKNDNNIGVQTWSMQGQEYSQLPDESNTEHFHRHNAMEDAEARFEGALDIDSDEEEEEEMELMKVDMNSEPEKEGGEEDHIRDVKHEEDDNITTR